MKRKPDRDALRRLDALAATLPTVACKGKCTAACGAIALTLIEAERLRLTAHRKPAHTPGDIRCVYLDAGRCSVYPIRPIVCRLYGVVRSLSCPFGCEPSRWLTPREQLDVWNAIAEIVGDDHIYATTATKELVRLPASIREMFARVAREDPDDAEVNKRDEILRTLRALHGGRIRAVVPGTGEYVNMDEDAG